MIFRVLGIIYLVLVEAFFLWASFRHGVFEGTKRYMGFHFNVLTVVYYLPVMLFFGPAVLLENRLSRNRGRQVNKYCRAAKKGDAEAQFNLGLLYKEGEGVPQNYVEALMWFDLAASRATAEAQKICADDRDDLAKQMPPAQIAEAQGLARNWKPKP